MPVKVRCRQCEKVFAAPDRARGKAVRCPGCREPVKVPAGKRKASPEAQEAGNAGDDSFFSSLDLSQSEDKTARLCPKCASDISVDDRICPNCHVNLRTGAVSSRMQKRLKRKGPNPVLFYKAAWADSWRFMLANQRLVFQTWIVNTGVALLQVGMVFVAFWIVVTFLPPAPDEMQMMAQGMEKEDEPYKVPYLSELLLENGFFIMSGLTVLLYVIVTGWIWTMAVQITRTTMARKDQAKRLSFQLVDSLANGFKMYFWSAIFPLPIMILGVPVMMLLAGGAAALSAGDTPSAAALMAIPVLIIAGGINLLITLSIPSALAHMGQKHTYKAWSFPLMAFTALRNIAPNLYLALIGLVCLILPVAVLVGGIAIVQLVLKVQFGPPHLLAWTELVGFGGVNEGSAGGIPAFPWKAVAGYLGTVVVGSLVGAYGMIFWMRAVGLYAYYYQQRLGLIQRTHPGQLAGFWSRYIAFLVDCLIIAVVGWIFEPIELWKMNEKGKLAAVLLAGLAVFFVVKFGFGPGIVLGYLALLPVCGFSYFARSESSKEQATLGKEAVGIMVSGTHGERLTFAQAGLRAFMKLLLGPAAFIAGFTPKKQALHDLVAATLVVFRGDLDRE